MADLQETGVAAPSMTMINGRAAIRACLMNHRSETSDVEALVSAVLATGRERLAALRAQA